MAVLAVVAEYNPFHNGHKYQIETIKKNSDDLVVAVMSGNAVQRGDFACFDKWERTKAALSSGADLVIELPSFYAVSTAEKFAFNAVYLLDKLNCVDKLCFGSETADIKTITKAADLVMDKKISGRIKELLSDGKTYAKARQQAVCEVDSICAEVLDRPNDILGVEYVKALKKLNSDITAVAVKRIGCSHDSSVTNKEFASASFLRENLSLETLKKFVPEAAYDIYEKALFKGNYSLSISSLSNALILKLRQAKKEDIEKLSDVSEGLHNRILSAAKEANDINELCEKIKTKRYTMSRIKRVLMYALLDFENIDILPQYIRVLGWNENGKKLVSNALLPVVTSLKRAKEINKEANLLAEMEERCTDAFNLTLKNKANAKNEFSVKPII